MKKEIEELITTVNNMNGYWRSESSEVHQEIFADIIDEASQKEGGIDLKEVIQIFRSFNDVAFENVKWAKKTNIDQLKENMNIIAADMLNERNNSLCG